MNKAEALYDKYEEDLKQLQDTCLHEVLSHWMDEYWAPGHGTGRTVQVCQECNKTIHSRIICTGYYHFKCANDVNDEQGYRHSGTDGYVAGLYCRECEDRITRRVPKIESFTVSNT